MRRLCRLLTALTSFLPIKKEVSKKKRISREKKLNRKNGIMPCAAARIQPQPFVLFTPARSEAVAAERAARMGATLRRGSKTAQKRPKASGVERPEGEHWRRERVRGSAPASAGARNVKGTSAYAHFSLHTTARRSPRGKPLAAAPAGGGAERRRGVERRGVLWACPQSTPRRPYEAPSGGIGGARKRPRLSACDKRLGYTLTCMRDGRLFPRQRIKKNRVFRGLKNRI